MNPSHLLSYSAAALLATLSAAAHAGGLVTNTGSGGGFYLGATGGYAQSNVDCSGTISCTRTGRGFKVFGGVHVIPHVNFEVQLHDYGHVKSDLPTSSVVIKNRGIGAGYAFIDTLGETWDGVFRIGIASNGSKTAASGVPVGPISPSDRSTQVYYGLGLAYRFASALSFHLDFDGTTFEPNQQRLRTTMFSAGFSYQF